MQQAAGNGVYGRSYVYGVERRLADSDGKQRALRQDSRTGMVRSYPAVLRISGFLYSEIAV